MRMDIRIREGTSPTSLLGPNPRMAYTHCGSRSRRLAIMTALCRLLFSTYKKHDVMSLITILGTEIADLKHFGYDVDRIRSQYSENLKKAEDEIPNGTPLVQAQPPAPSPVEEQPSSPPTARAGEDITNGTPPVEAQPPALSPVEKRASSPRVVLNKPMKWLKWLHGLRKDPKLKLGEMKPSEIENSIKKVKDIMKEKGGEHCKHINSRVQVGGGKKQKNVDYCDEEKIPMTDLDECSKPSD
ncbi:uncharacterized protein EDB91DRAFT_142154 [Suillus paluster]|uniref:uncharacterized protein n=1 Tax=Suillus paluster TaxID=48578 RepID=UPI001B87AD0C|nr:uncharacterized protein EDB91DRAFT_142154 [Suillus paluster]KAG1724398.1 hypothetical protein EDB91DRAFT_142154 [Suillus paluster]